MKKIGDQVMSRKRNRYNTDPFQVWRENKKGEDVGFFYSPQINYSPKDGSILHVIFEKGKNYNSNCNLKFMNPNLIVDVGLGDRTSYLNTTKDKNRTNVPELDYRFPIYLLKEGKTEDWDYNRWARDYLGCTKPIERISEPESYDDYRRLKYPRGSMGCDIDSIERAMNGCWFGVEATRFNLREKDGSFSPKIEKKSDVTDYLFDMIIAKRPFGFNRGQLLAQLNFMNQFGGKLFLIIFSAVEENINCSDWVLLEEEYAYACEVNFELLACFPELDLCRSIQKESDLTIKSEKLNELKLYFSSIAKNDCLDKFVNIYNYLKESGDVMTTVECK
ncbi:hypothetical protein RFA52_003693 [Vibrio alginolyticus]|nr:hypothetical protein [Vibrio alginolyticus]